MSLESQILGELLKNLDEGSPVQGPPHYSYTLHLCKYSTFEIHINLLSGPAGRIVHSLNSKGVDVIFCSFVVVRANTKFVRIINRKYLLAQRLVEVIMNFISILILRQFF